MAMETAGFIFRLSSSPLLFQIYRLGPSTVHTSLPHLSDSDLGNSFLEPPVIANQRSRSDEILRESFHEPANPSTLIVDGERSITSPRTTQINRLGASTVDSSLPHQSLSDSDLRNSFLEPPTVTANQPSRSEEVLRKSFHEPAYSSPPIFDGDRNITSPKTTQNSGGSSEDVVSFHAPVVYQNQDQIRSSSSRTESPKELALIPQRVSEVHQQQDDLPIPGQNNPLTSQIHTLYREKHRIQRGKSSPIEAFSCFMEIDEFKPWSTLHRAIQEMWLDYLKLPPPQDLKTVCKAYKKDQRFTKAFLKTLKKSTENDKEKVVHLLFKKAKDKMRRKERERGKQRSEEIQQVEETQVEEIQQVEETRVEEVISQEEIDHNLKTLEKRVEKKKENLEEIRRQKEEKTKTWLKKQKEDNSTKEKLDNY